jgi:dienelactone hydrolase
MKKSTLFLAVTLATVGLIVPFRAYSGSSDTRASGEQFVDLLAKGDFAGAVARYDQTMRAALPEPKLREAWQSVEAQAGGFRKRLQTRLLKIESYDVALVTCEFERAKLETKVVFNAQGEVSGLFFLPSTAGTESAGLPSYVRTNAFREKDFVVGSGEWRLPGTLTLPLSKNGKRVPAIVLVHGSGPNDRDETIGAARPFRDLAWGLATKGVAVLRYEKRTKEYAARFIADKPKLTAREETIDDALVAVNQLRQSEGIESNRIFVLGHSFGGTVAPRIGEADVRIAGLIVMAGATRHIEDMLVEQNRYILSLPGVHFSFVEQEQLRDLEAKVAQIKKLTSADESSSTVILGAPPAYWLDLRAHDPVAEASRLKQPVLILQGGRDYQVTPAQFDEWKKGLEGSTSATFKLYSELNHLFIAGKGKSTPQEYDAPGHVAEEVVTDITDWVLKVP